MISRFDVSTAEPTLKTNILAALERDGLVIIEGLLSPESLRSAATAFSNQVERVSFDGEAGYHRADLYRRMVHDVLRLDRAFMDAPLNDVILDVADEYLGADFCLTEAKAWRTERTLDDFHTWHNDAWYDQTLDVVPRQIKLAMYLTDVKSGPFAYVKGTHGNVKHRHWRGADLDDYRDQVVEVIGKAGTAVLFDVSGMHRQQYPVLEERDAVFYVFNDPSVPVQPEDLASNRYHPLLLNAAFLGGLDERKQRVLGFGNETLLRPASRPPARHPHLRSMLGRAYDAYIKADQLRLRTAARIDRVSRALPFLPASARN